MVYLVAGLVGYLLGAVPTGVLVSRLWRGVDVRERGSGHTGGTNVSGVAGVWGGVLIGAVDVLPGVAAIVVARHLTPNPWAATLSGAPAVVGHNRSLFIRFAGGIGLSSLAGTLLTLDPLHTLEALPVVVIAWFILVGMLHLHRARTTILVMLLVGPLLWALGAPPPVVVPGPAGGLAVAVKTIPDWNREYKEGR